MDLLVAAASDPSGQGVRLIVVLLVAVAVALAGLTVWYWRFTSPVRDLPTTDADQRLANVTTDCVDPDAERSPAPVAMPMTAAQSKLDPAVTGQIPAVGMPGSVVYPTAEGPMMDFLAEGEDVAASVDKPIATSESTKTAAADHDTSEGGDQLDRIGPPVDLEFSVLSEAGKTAEINLTADQWEQLADAVLGVIGWGSLADDMMLDEPEPPLASVPLEVDAGHSVGTAD